MFILIQNSITYRWQCQTISLHSSLNNTCTHTNTQTDKNALNAKHHCISFSIKWNNTLIDPSNGIQHSSMNCTTSTSTSVLKTAYHNDLGQQRYNNVTQRKVQWLIWSRFSNYNSHLKLQHELSFFDIKWNTDCFPNEQPHSQRTCTKGMPRARSAKAIPVFWSQDSSIWEVTNALYPSNREKHDTRQDGNADDEVAWVSDSLHHMYHPRFPQK